MVDASDGVWDRHLRVAGQESTGKKERANCIIQKEISYLHPSALNWPTERLFPPKAGIAHRENNSIRIKANPSHTSQRAAVPKGIRPNEVQGVGEGHFSQRAAIAKGTTANPNN